MAITKQGNTLQLAVNIRVDKKPLDLNKVEKIEFVFGRIVKVYPYDCVVVDNNLIVVFSQSDTSRLSEIIKYQARIRFKDGQVRGTPIYQGEIAPSLSKEVL